MIKSGPNEHGTTTNCSEDFSRWSWEDAEKNIVDDISEAAAKVVIGSIAEDAELGLWNEEGEVFVTLTAFEFELVIQAPFAGAVDVYLELQTAGDGFANREGLQPLLDALDAARAKVVALIRED